jgi:hypothetical protein
MVHVVRSFMAGRGLAVMCQADLPFPFIFTGVAGVFWLGYELSALFMVHLSLTSTLPLGVSEVVVEEAVGWHRGARGVGGGGKSGCW